jgi:hypothetical protein
MGEGYNMAGSATDLISRYGAVLEATAGAGAMGTFEAVLPASKHAIKEAIKKELLLLALARQLLPEHVEPLKTGYMLLATFVPDADARTLQDAARAYAQLETMDPREWSTKYQSVVDRAQPLTRAIVDNQAFLLSEVNDWVLRVQASAAEREGKAAEPDGPRQGSGGWLSRLFG